jgi:hypothetical protein
VAVTSSKPSLGFETPDHVLERGVAAVQDTLKLVEFPAVQLDVQGVCCICGLVLRCPDLRHDLVDALEVLDHGVDDHLFVDDVVQLVWCGRVANQGVAVDIADVLERVIQFRSDGGREVEANETDLELESGRLG